MSGPDYPSVTPLQDAAVSSNAGNDSISAGAGDDRITTGTGQDTVDAGAGNDMVYGGPQADSIAGGSGNDRIEGCGGAGNDTISGGTGNDTILGGAGSDSQTGGDGFDIFTVSSGNDVITDFNTGTGQDTGDGNQSNNDFLNLSPYFTSIFEARRDLEHNGLLDQPVGDDDYSDNAALPGTIFLGGTPAADLTFDNVNLVCFAAGARILTPSTARAVEKIVKGDLVTMLDRGSRPVRWVGQQSIGSETLRQHERLRPILIRAASLGHGLPHRDLPVSPQHRILISSPIVRRMFGVDEVLAPAKKLVGMRGIERDDSCVEVTYVHLLLERHEILFAEGAPAERLFTGQMAMTSLDRDARAVIAEIVPDNSDAGQRMRKARTLPSGRALRSMILRHKRNDRALLENFFENLRVVSRAEQGEKRQEIGAKASI